MTNYEPDLPLKRYIEDCIYCFSQTKDENLIIHLDNYEEYNNHKYLFPDDICNISKRVKKLTIYNRGNLHLIKNLDQFTECEHIYIAEMTSTLLEQILNLPKLKTLEFVESNNLDLSIYTLKKIANIKDIRAPMNIYGELLNNNLSLGNVKELSINNENKDLTTKVLNSANNIECISINGFSDLNFINFINLNKLKTLRFNGKITTKCIEEISKLNNLTEINFFSYFMEEASNEGVIDISKLSNLSNLEKLVFFRPSKDNTKLIGTESLLKLKNLLSLNAGNIKIENSEEILCKLTKLKELFVDLKESTNLSFLKQLKNLETLSISSTGTLNIDKYLIDLTKLKELIIRGNCNISTQTLSNLSELKYLYLNGDIHGNIDKNNRLSTLDHLTVKNTKVESFLEICPYLKSIEIIGSPLPISIKTISEKLTFLEISDAHEPFSLNNIQSLYNIEELRLYDTKLNSLNGISNLKKLKSFFIFDNEALADISDLYNCSNLLKICLYCDIDIKIRWDLAQKLFFDGITTNFINDFRCDYIPEEITTPSNAKHLKSWYLEILKHGFDTPSRVKVMLLGNGRIGKTQLSRRLKKESYDESISSTHGIEVFNIPEENNNNVELQVWDFGGQDVYLGTHSLFIDRRSVYLLLWTPKSENTNLVECESIAIRNRPLSYWLAYLKSLAGEDANVLICQSQCDNASDGQTAPIPQPNPIKNIFPIPISAKTDSGLKIFEPSFSLAIERQLQQNGEVWIPNSWLAVEKEINKLSQDKNATLEHSKFIELCETHNVLAPEALATYFHQVGTVFYRPGCFNNQLILDQQWALQGVYLLLHREDALPNLMQMDGKFNTETIERLLWKHSDKSGNTKLFIEMMNQCGACFKVNDDWYIAPDALPEKSAMELRIEQIWQDTVPNFHVRLNYDFLHDATMRFLLSKIGASAKAEACYWKYGCCYYDGKHKAKVHFDCCILSEDEKRETQSFINYGQPGYIDIKIKAASPALIEHLVESIIETNHLDAKATVEWLKGEPKEKEKRVEQEQKEPFANIGKGELDPNRKPNVYFSYAWGKDENDPKQKVCDEIYEKLTLDDTIQVFRDKDSMSSGDSIEAFEKQIGRADFVLMIISEKSLYESEHCMNELRLVYERAQNEKQTFINKVVPVIMKDAKIDTQIDILQVVRSWKKKKDELDSLIKEVGEAAGAESANQQQMMTAFINSAANALKWLSDLVIDRTPELQADTAVSLLKKRIAEANK